MYQPIRFLINFISSFLFLVCTHSCFLDSFLFFLKGLLILSMHSILDLLGVVPFTFAFRRHICHTSQTHSPILLSPTYFTVGIFVNVKTSILYAFTSLPSSFFSCHLSLLFCIIPVIQIVLAQEYAELTKGENTLVLALSTYEVEDINVVRRPQP